MPGNAGDPTYRRVKKKERSGISDWVAKSERALWFDNSTGELRADNRLRLRIVEIEKVKEFGRIGRHLILLTIGSDER